MCITSTSIVHGTAVRLSSLLFAADAFPSLEPTLRFFDLVSLRFRTGTLEFERRGGVEPAVSRVPPEVWQMFEEELVADELEEADNLFSDEVLGDQHAGWTWEEVTVGWVEDDWGIADRLYDNFRSSVFASARQARLKRLLEAYGLAVPNKSLQYLLEHHEVNVDIYAVSYLTIATSAFQNGAVYGSDCQRGRGMDYTMEENLSDVSFNLPPRAEQRFLPVIRLFHLELIKITAVSPLPPQPRPAGARRLWRPPKGPQLKFEVQALEDVQPGWKLQPSISVW